MHTDILLFLYKNNRFTDSLIFESQLDISNSIEQWPVKICKYKCKHEEVKK